MAERDGGGATAGGRRASIVAAARALLEDEGADGLTMRRLAERLGIQAPSLYKHFPGKAALEAAIVSAALEEQAVAFEEALAGAPADPLAALARAYRAHALAHPHLYRLVNAQALPRDLLPDGLEARAAAPLVAAAGGAPGAARAAWAFAHGMVMLELDGRFPPDADLDQAWGVGIAAFRPAPRARARRR